MIRRTALVSLTFAALLSGCGAVPTTTSVAEAPEAQRPAPVAPPSAAPRPDAEGPRLLAGLRQAFLACKGIEANVSSYSEGHFKSGKKVDELRKNTSTTKLIWAKPNRMRGEIVKTDNFLVSGARMVSTDGSHITVRAGGVLGILPIKLSASDDMLASNRNHHFGDMTPNALLTWIMGPQASWTVIGQSTVKGAPVVLVRISNIKHLDGEITEERLAIEPATFAVRNLAMYAGTKKVVDYTFQTFRWNPNINSSTFEL